MNSWKLNYSNVDINKLQEFAEFQKKYILDNFGDDKVGDFDMFLLGECKYIADYSCDNHNVYQLPNGTRIVAITDKFLNDTEYFTVYGNQETDEYLGHSHWGESFDERRLT